MKELDNEKMRHSMAHVMAAAVCKLYDDVKLDIGPATADGFYYDFDLPVRLTPEEFPAIEVEMSRIIKEDVPFERFELSRTDAEKQLEESGQTYKLERLAEIPEDETLTFYRCGDFVDLCRGPHVERTGQLKAFKLISVAGSYFHGIETNPMLQRIYGLTANSPKEIRAELQKIEEAKKRDHRKIGKQLDLFSIEDDVGPGLVHWHPKGARIRSVIEDFWRKRHYDSGYELLYSPHIGQAHLWETSGHLDFYRESMYASMDIDGVEYFLRPMNCPFHIQVYKSQKRSYRELPLLWAELGTVYRYEKSGVVQGLLRVRGFTQDDAHIFCAPEQVEGEIRKVVTFALGMLRAFGFEDVTAYLSTRPEKAVGDDARWEQATQSLESALKAEGIEYEVDAGGGAFYGPKIDLKIKDALGREWQLSTVQFDFNLPERFDLTYVGSDGKEQRPYMVHRALLGSLERFFGILIEHYAGAFPLWLAPEQVRVLPVTDNQNTYADKVYAMLKEAGFRPGVDSRSERVGAKIRLAQTEKIPYMLIVGPKEVEEGTVSVRARIGGDQGAMRIEDLLSRLNGENQINT
ncbi:MAG: threonine--tRNA ligase [Kiritimatiellae bacterium]|nr:threonine--tRNA ligase [Kiritimatiellia bacterium]